MVDAANHRGGCDWNYSEPRERPVLSQDEIQNGVHFEQEVNVKLRQDSLWSWFVCFCASFSLALALGVTFSYGVLFPVLMGYFKESREKTAWLGSLAMSFTFLFGPVCGVMIQRFGCRITCIIGGVSCSAGLLLSSLPKTMFYLFGTYSLLHGFGCSCIFTSTLIISTIYFNRHRSLATGIVTAGQSAGVLIFGPVLQALLDAFGWRTTFQVAGGTLALVCFLAITFSENVDKSSPERVVSNPHIRALDVPLYKNMVFVVITVSSSICMFGEYVPQIHIISYSQSLGISADDGSKLYILFGLGSSISRIGTGLICDNKRVNPRWLYQATEYCIGIAIVLSPLAKAYSNIAAYFFFYGFFEGVYVTTLNIHLLNCAVPNMRPLAFGVCVACNSLFTASGPPIAGLMADKFNTYAPSFYMAGSVIILGATVAFMIPLLSKQSNVKQGDATTFDTQL